jgi:hypothetical protein
MSFGQRSASILKLIFTAPDSLPDSIFIPYYHSSLVKKKNNPELRGIHPPKIHLEKMKQRRSLSAAG